MSGSQRPAAVWSFSSSRNASSCAASTSRIFCQAGVALSFSHRLAPELGDLTVLLDLLRRILERSGALHLDVDDLGPLLLAAVDRLEGVHRLEVGTDLEELAPCVGRVERLRELLAVDLAELAEDLLELLGVEHRRRAIHHLVERA